MSIQYYLRQNPLVNGKAFFAQTIFSRTLEQEEILAYMVQKNTALSITELRGVVNLLKSTLKELLTQGNRLVIDDLLTLYPAVQATFERNNEAFNHNTGRVKVNCRIAGSLNEDVSKMALVEKSGKADNLPTLKNIISGMEKENVVRWPYATKVIGEKLNPQGQKIKGISILNQNDVSQIFTIGEDYLVLDSQSEKEVTFSISNQCPVPEWLTAELPIFLQLEYPGEGENRELKSTSIKTFWIRQAEIIETNENVNTQQF